MELVSGLRTPVLTFLLDDSANPPETLTVLVDKPTDSDFIFLYSFSH